MEDTAKSASPPPEEAAFRRYYNHLLRCTFLPAQLAELLFSDGIIRRETKDSINSDEDEEHAKRVLLDAVQCALTQARDTVTTMRSLCTSLKKSGVHGEDIRLMKNFVAGEYNFVKAASVIYRFGRTFCV